MLLICVEDFPSAEGDQRENSHARLKLKTITRWRFFHPASDCLLVANFRDNHTTNLHSTETSKSGLIKSSKRTNSICGWSINANLHMFYFKYSIRKVVSFNLYWPMFLLCYTKLVFHFYV